MKIIWICTVWPEFDSTAAGFRTTLLLNVLLANGHEVNVLSACKDNDYRIYLESIGCKTFRVLVNDESFDVLIAQINPDIAVFDRFMIEEQFGWRVRDVSPQTMRILDTVDLHFLRRQRQACVVSSYKKEEVNTDLYSSEAMREISSIYRCDGTLVTSYAEIKLLNEKYQVPRDLLWLVSFSYLKQAEYVSFHKRKNLVFIGNFKHDPNVDAYNVLRQGLWRQIKNAFLNKGIGDVELHIYGAYMNESNLRDDDQESGFRVLGKAVDAREVLSKYRVNLAPLRFGAGIKGKIADGWCVGTPCVATQYASEGMTFDHPFGGLLANDWDDFADSVVRLYCNEADWLDTQRNGINLIDGYFNAEINDEKFMNVITSTYSNLDRIRANNIVGSLLWYTGQRCTEYFSRWIECKNKLSQIDSYQQKVS